MANKSSKPERQTRRSPAELRELLLGAAKAEFGSKGYASTSTRDVAKRAGVALSVLYRHFETKADLFSEAVLDPFVRGFEQLGADWMSQLAEPLPDQAMMEIFIRDVYGSVAANQRALDQMLSGRAELPEAMVQRIRAAFEKLIGQLRLMTELEARRRGWTSTLGPDMTVRIVLAMLMGMSAYSWLLEPETGPDEVRAGMVKLALWGASSDGDSLAGM
ncbi:regulatory protein TetR [Mycolicibacterium rhodesiae JS60]|nr:regulatory protein TetR [Mycolicibacterium rhodesiae JS60]